MAFHRLVFAISLLALGLLPATVHAADKHAYILATATTGGTYYPVGVALSTLTKIKLEPATGISLSAITSAGSAENVKLLREGEAQFAILQGVYGAWAWNGTGRLEQEGPQTYLRSVTLLWDNAEHFLLRADQAPTGTMADLKTLKGKKFSVGNRNSGAEGSNSLILSALGIDTQKDLTPVYQGYGPSADALQNGTIVGMSTPAGPPVSAVTRAFASGRDLRLLSFTDDDLAKVNAALPIWFRYTIPAETYPGQSQDVASIAYPNILSVRADVDDQAVYEITKAIYENLAFLGGIHVATKAMSLAKAVQGLPAPLHSGAARYYQEQGLTIPEALLPPAE